MEPTELHPGWYPTLSEITEFEGLYRNTRVEALIALARAQHEALKYTLAVIERSDGRSGDELWRAGIVGVAHSLVEAVEKKD